MFDVVFPDALAALISDAGFPAGEHSIIIIDSIGPAALSPAFVESAASCSYEQLRQLALFAFDSFPFRPPAGNEVASTVHTRGL